MLLIVALCLFSSSEYVLGECNEGCEQPTMLYEDLNCKPIFATPGDCCPSKYDCTQIEQKGNEDAEKCYFHEKSYNPGESLNDDDIYKNCKVNCSCRKKESGEMGFTCADCPEWLGRHAAPGCHLKYELNKCCGGEELCPPFNATCKVSDDETYHEGMRFYAPDDKCTQCVCQAGFEGKFEPPFCTKRGCVEEVDHQKEVYQFCAPVYISLDDCCPLKWVCPENDTVVEAKSPSDNGNLKCRFGDKALNIGDTFERIDDEYEELSCECRIPPYLTCIRDYDYLDDDDDDDVE